MWISGLAMVLTAMASITATTYYFGVGPFVRVERARVVVSTTTSLYDTGLLDLMEDRFEAEHPIDLYFISVGTGLAMQHAQRGDADMVVVHAPLKEFSFLEEGYGVCRKIIAYNFFVIVGPGDDPAGVRDVDVEEALERVVEAGRKGMAIWVSRGDDSGTHTKEKGLWKAAGFEWLTLRDESWYREAGAGMGKTLQITNEFSAYTLTDLGTYLKYRTDDLISLVVVVSKGKMLLNVYSVIVVNRDSNPDVNFDGAVTFVKFLVSVEGQGIIDHYGEDLYGEKLFYPASRLLKEKIDPVHLSWIEEYAYFDGSECPSEHRSGCSELYEQILSTSRRKDYDRGNP